MLEDAKRAGKPLVGRIARQRRRRPRRASGARHPARCPDRSDLRPRPGQRLSAAGLERRAMGRAARKRPQGTRDAAMRSMAKHVECLLQYKARGLPVFDYGNNLRQMAKDAGVARAFDIPGFVPEYIRPLFCRGVGPFRWAALSGDPEDIYKTDAKVRELIPDDPHLHHWLDMARDRIHFQGLPARICWVGLGQRHRLGLAFNQMVADGELSAPIVIGRDHLDSGSVASPNRETEAMRDGSDAVSDWPLLNALLNTASGATWVSIHHGGGVGMGYSQHAGVVIVCDGTEAAARRLRRVLWNDPASGVMRHADAGYQTRHRLRARARSRSADDRAAVAHVSTELEVRAGSLDAAPAAADLRGAGGAAPGRSRPRAHRRGRADRWTRSWRRAKRPTASTRDSACLPRPVSPMTSSRSCSAICCYRTPRASATRSRMRWCASSSRSRSMRWPAAIRVSRRRSSTPCVRCWHTRSTP